MAGHSKWANIKRRKGAQDAKRGKIFTKVVREITTAARLGGGDSGANPRLRAAIAAAKAERMPADNIERAIKKGTGTLEGAEVEEIVYEGYGPQGVAVVIEAQTDNRNRTTSDVRSIFTRAGGNLGTSGSVAWMFHKHGQFCFDAAKYTEDELMAAALDAGAQDVQRADEHWVVLCAPADFSEVLDSFEAHGYAYASAEFTMIPESSIQVAGKDAQRVLKLVEKLEDLDDVQEVYANFDIADVELDRLA